MAVVGDEEEASTTAWDRLDDNVRACVLLHLEPGDLARVSLASRAMTREAQADAVWATLFLRRFGDDFWGEQAGGGPHPYDHRAERRANPWRSMPAASVFAAFVHDAERNVGGETDGETTRSRLLAFAQQQQRQEAATSADSGGGGHNTQPRGGWKRAYRDMHEIVRAWQSPAAVGVLVAGETSFDRLSAIVDIIKKVITHATDDSPFHETLPSSCLDALSPSGGARVLRLAACLQRTRAWINLCAIRRPRVWWPESHEDLHFRGLQLDESPVQRIYVVYAIDCERMADPEHQELVFRELHGFLGEGRGQFQQGLFVNLHLINAPADFGPERILERLKIPPYVVPDHWCPFYAGPVVFAVSSCAMPATTAAVTDEPAEERREREELVMRCLWWLFRQPMAGRPQAYFPHDLDNAWLCALTDARADAQRRNFDAWS